MGQVCTREEAVANDPGDNNAAPGFQQAPLKQAVVQPAEPVHHQPQAPVAAPVTQQSAISASQIEDLHINAGSLEPTNRMNVISSAVQRKLDSLPALTIESRPELKAKYAASSHGGSIMKERSSQATYQGQMHRGVPHGYGRMVGVDGSVTEGWFDEGKPNGYVRHILTSGQVYEGEFRDHHANGVGRQIDPNGVVTECQTWVNGQPTGRVIQRQGQQVVFEGTLNGGKKTGECKWYDNQGKTHYAGVFVNDKLDGQGKAVGDNGEQYVGAFKNGVPEGAGVKTFVDGRTFQGTFVNGKASGQGTFTSDSGAKTQQTWKDGKRV